MDRLGYSSMSFNQHQTFAARRCKNTANLDVGVIERGPRRIKICQVENSPLRYFGVIAGLSSIRSSFIFIFYVFCLLFIVFDNVGCSSSQLRSQSAVDARLVRYLTRYGYLSDSNPFTANLRSSEALKESIKEMQKFGGINQTGVMDPSTIHLMNSRRCGVPDISGLRDRVKRYTLQGQKWPSNQVTWTVKQWARGLDHRAARTQFKKALQIWSKHSKLSFREVRRVDADIVISFYQGQHNDGHPFDGRGNILAHAFFPGKGREGDAHFDSNELWVPHEPKPDSEEVSLFAVAAHEFGHSLGLSHSSVPGALMFPYYNGFKETDELPRDDIIGIQQLYGSKHPNKWAPIKPVVTQAPPTRTKKPYKPWNPRRTRPPTVPKIPPKNPPRRPTEPKVFKPTKKISIDEKPPPNTCKTTIDAISTVRTEIFAFKDKYFWRINSENKLATSYPIPIHHFWVGFPKDLTHIDALYERPGDHKIVFFSGDKYWVFNNVRAQSGYPKPLTNLGLPKSVKKIDSAMVWGQNGKTYFFSGKQYWRYSEEDGRVEYDYPRHTRVWGGVPSKFDASFQWSDGRTYFFKDHFFWLFNDKKMKIDKFGPKQITAFWFNCKKDKSIPLPKPKVTHSRNRIYDQLYGVDSSSSINHSLSFSTILLSITIIVLYA